MHDLIVFPDAVAITCTFLRAELSGTHVSSCVPVPRPAAFVIVRRVGVVRRNLVVDGATMTVECWGASAEDARELARHCRARLHAAVDGYEGGRSMYLIDEVDPGIGRPVRGFGQRCCTFTVAVPPHGVMRAAS